MIGFADCNPIIDEDDIPSFTSVDDILNRSLNLYDDVIRVSIYKTDGTLIATKERKNLNKSKQSYLFNYPVIIVIKITQ